MDLLLLFNVINGISFQRTYLMGNRTAIKRSMARNNMIIFDILNE